VLILCIVPSLFTTCLKEIVRNVALTIATRLLNDVKHERSSDDDLCAMVRPLFNAMSGVGDLEAVMPSVAPQLVNKALDDVRQHRPFDVKM